MTNANTFIGVKKILAHPMTREEYNNLRGWTVPENENPADDGYLVEYLGSAPQPELVGKVDGYASWSPKDVFDQAHIAVRNADVDVDDVRNMVEELASASKELVSFETALHYCKRGMYIARKGWNGKGMSVRMVKGTAIQQALNKHYGDPDDSRNNQQMNNFLVLSSVDGTLNTWVPSISDLLANDWIVS